MHIPKPNSSAYIVNIESDIDSGINQIFARLIQAQNHLIHPILSILKIDLYDKRLQTYL